MKRKLLLIIVSIVVIMSIGFSLVACNKDDATNDNQNNSNNNPDPPPVPIYTITYNLDGGINNASNPATHQQGQEITLQDPTKDGYYFDGWYLESTFSTKVTKVSGNGDVVLYAKWIPSPVPTTYTITYNLDEGVNNASNPATYYLGEEITLQDPTKDGYNFDGWYLESTFSTKVTKVSGDGDITLYAKWNATEYTITYNLNGGTNSASNPSTYTVEDEITFINPEKTGYDGVWKKGEDEISSISVGSTGNIELTAEFTIHNYTITYNLNGGTNIISNPNTYTIEDEITLQDPTKDYYTFNGWYSDSEFKNKVTSISKGSYEDISLYAKWTPISYSITYNLNGGTNSASNPSTYTIENEITLQNPTKINKEEILSSAWLSNGNYGIKKKVTHYTFEGWYLESTFDTKVEKISGHQDVALYAKWSENVTTPATEQAYKKEKNYIYLGIYPQSKVTDSTLISSLNTLAGTLPTYSNNQAWTSYGYYKGYDNKSGSQSNTTNYMWYIDKEYNGEKYRGVYFILYRPDYTYKDSTESNSYQDDYGYNASTVYWFKYEPIKWRILSEGNEEALIFCDMIIDAQEYYWAPGHSSGAFPNNWEESTIRAWLNETFYNTAFSSLQKSIIVQQTLTTFKPFSETTETTNDNVFLLTQQDVTNSSYGFSSSSARERKTTAYAQSQGAYTWTSKYGNGNGYWWLRTSPTNESVYMYYVLYEGNAEQFYSNVNRANLGVVPALKIKLGSSGIPTQTTYTITYNLDGGTNNSSNPATYQEGQEVTLQNPTKIAKEGVSSLSNGSYSVKTTQYTFEGWYLESTFDTKVEKISGHQDVVLYAKWSEDVTTTEQVYTREDNYIYFGSYPQSKVTDDSLISTLNTLAGTLPASSNSQTWTPYGYYQGDGNVDSETNTTNYMWYIDKEYNGEKYRGVYFTSYRPNATYYSSGSGTSYQDDYGYNASTVYWFKYEPIKWRILSERNGEVLILCDMIIDSQDFNYTDSNHTSGAPANDWEESIIRAWLNETFYNTAFNDLQKSLIVQQTLITDKSNGGTETTKDNVFLLTQQDVTNSSYGFNTSDTSNDPARQKKTTAYAQSQGAYTSTSKDYSGNGYWWLRSPATYLSSREYHVVQDGFAITNNNVSGTSYGVAPALKIKLD